MDLVVKGVHLCIMMSILSLGCYAKHGRKCENSPVTMEWYGSGEELIQVVWVQALDGGCVLGQDT